MYTKIHICPVFIVCLLIVPAIRWQLSQLQRNAGSDLLVVLRHKI